MRKLSRLIHSAHHLFVFEVCGRLQSFTLAAQELGVSQPAVSLAIRQLEESIGQKLFKREYRQVSFTQAGRKLYAEVAVSLERIWLAANDINSEKGGHHVTLSGSTAFANYWMVPKLSAFHQAHPNIDLRLQVVDKDIDLHDLTSSLGVRNGNGKWPSYCAHKLASECLIPIASPAYLQKNGRPSSIEQLLSHHLIHLEEPYRDRATWAQWLSGVSGQPNHSLSEGLMLNDYALVIQAVIAGEGVALGWSHIVEGLLKSGVLEVAYDESWSSENDTWLIWSEQVTLTPNTLAVKDWIINKAI